MKITTTRTVDQILDSYSDRVIAFRRDFVNATGSVLASLLLSQALYWDRIARKAGRREWWKTQKEWEDETGMKRAEFETARRRLVELGFLSHVRRGLPAKTFYFLNREGLARALSAEPSDDVTPDNSRLLDSSNLDCLIPAICIAGFQQSHPSTDDSEMSSDISDSGEDASVAPARTGREPGQARSLRSPSPELKEGQVDRLLRAAPDAAPSPRTNADRSVSALGQAAALEARRRGVNADVGRRVEQVRVRTGGIASERRNKRERDPMQAVMDEDARADRKADLVRAATTRREPAPDKPERGSAPELWITWATDRIRQTRAEGGGVRAPEEWTGPDTDQFLSDLVEGVLGQERPDSTPQSRKQAQGMIRSLGGERARDLLIYVVSNWATLKASLKIEAAAPSCALVLGYLESIKSVRAGTRAAPGGEGPAGSNRGNVDYSKGPSSGWGSS